MNESEVQRKRQVVLITGAARGIGRAIADRLASDGHHLALNDNRFFEIFSTGSGRQPY